MRPSKQALRDLMSLLIRTCFRMSSPAMAQRYTSIKKSTFRLTANTWVKSTIWRLRFIHRQSRYWSRMSSTVPILLSFYALSNGTKTLLTGQLTYSSLRDFSFKSYSTRKTFRTILALYRTRFFANQHVTLHFDIGTVQVKTDASGSFFLFI